MEHLREHYAFFSEPVPEPVAPLKLLKERERQEQVRYQQLLRQADLAKEVESPAPQPPVVFQYSPHFVPFHAHDHLTVSLE